MLLKMLVLRDRPWRQLDLALALGISPAEVVHALGRLRFAGLIDEQKRAPKRLAVLEFLVHGLKYVFPAEVKSVARGIPTGHSAKPISNKIISDEFDSYVWPSPDGKSRGLAVNPLYQSAPLAAQQDSELYEFLALIDCLRIGRGREQKIAAEELRNRILKGHDEFREALR